MHLYNFSKAIKPLLTAAGAADTSNDLSLLSSSSTLWVVGCDLPGKLIDRTLENQRLGVQTNVGNMENDNAAVRVSQSTNCFKDKTNLLASFFIFLLKLVNFAIPASALASPFRLLNED
ncbi:hypothetical protein H5410_008441 [Solanum commersonii]|uniref:Uncharacterized protein n=1 Tax=Solanum commersonii TaxID=4109 RepID=A0A9J6AGS6_SOLCO|nr:hypothetical protein H5410_008441 [Solanum commersonii]